MSTRPNNRSALSGPSGDTPSVQSPTGSVQALASAATTPSLTPLPAAAQRGAVKPMFVQGKPVSPSAASPVKNSMTEPHSSSENAHVHLGGSTRGSIFDWIELASRHLMNFIPIIIGLHAALILAGWLSVGGEGAFGHPVESARDLLPWLLAVALIALGSVGYSNLYYRLDAAGLRVLLALAAVWGLCLWHGGYGLFDWYFVILVAIYPVFLHQRYGLAIPWVAAAGYLSLSVVTGNLSQIVSLQIGWFAGLLVIVGHVAFALGLASQHYRQLHKLAHTDELTGLSNRRHFRESVERELELVRRDGRPLTLITYDLDSFKQINDEHGHLSGDIVLRHFADVLRLNTRRNDVVARIGGDEFAVVLPDMNAEAAQSYVRSILETLSMEHIAIPGGTIQLSASAGVVTADKKGPYDIHELMRRSDENLYRSKRSRRRSDADSERRKRSLLITGGVRARKSAPGRAANSSLPA